MGEYMAMQQDLRDYAALQKAVREFLDEMEECDQYGERLRWPINLEQMVGWKPKLDENN